MLIRKACAADIDAIAAIYQHVHKTRDQFTGWVDGVYPTRATAVASLERDDLFVMEDMGQIVGTAIFNQQQLDCYALGHWQLPCLEEQVMVMHTLAIEPSCAGRGYGRAFVHFYEAFAVQHQCTVLRIDTQARNTPARSMYHSLGFSETDIVPCVFNGIPDVQLVLLEKEAHPQP